MMVGQDNVIKTVFVDTFHLKSTRDPPQSSPNREQMSTFTISFPSAITLCTGFPYKHSLPTPQHIFSANLTTGTLCQHPHRHFLSTPTTGILCQHPHRHSPSTPTTGILCQHPHRHSLTTPTTGTLCQHPHRHFLSTPTTGTLCQHPHRHSLSTTPQTFSVHTPTGILF